MQVTMQGGAVKKKLKLWLLAALGVGATTLSAGASAEVLLELVNPPAQTDTPYSLSFTATGSPTTLSVAGYQLPSSEQVTLNGVYLGTSTTNLLGMTWSFVPAAHGSGALQYSDGTSVNALSFAGVSPGSYDTYSQSFSTIAGDTYTYKFDFTEQAHGPSSLVVSVSAVPLPASAWLLLSGLVGVGVMARKHRAA
jgi:hypothetical protein